jgi:hypothetical protein
MASRSARVREIILSDARAMHMIMSGLFAYGRGESILQNEIVCEHAGEITASYVRLETATCFKCALIIAADAALPVLAIRTRDINHDKTLKGGVTVGPLLPPLPQLLVSRRNEKGRT